MLKFKLPYEYCNKIVEYVFTEVALKNNFIQKFIDTGKKYVFEMEDGDLYSLFNVPISTLGYSKNKLNFITAEWNYCINYLIGEYTDEYGNIQEQTPYFNGD